METINKNCSFEQLKIDAELELEMIPIRKENKKEIIQGIAFLSILFGYLWAFKTFLLPLILV